MTAHSHHLDLMGITTWKRRDLPGESEGNMETENDSARIPVTDSVQSSSNLDELRLEVSACTRCALSETRTQTVFGTGNPNACVMIIGEAPGADEDRLGEPFVGRAGQLLNAMLAAIGIGREDVYIVNILKCRPPRNRDPESTEVEACSPFLHRQIEWVDPSLIVAVGRVAAQTLLQSTTPIGRLRGRPHQYRERSLLVTYHPAYLLRSPGEKRKAWDDLKQIRTHLRADSVSSGANP